MDQSRRRRCQYVSWVEKNICHGKLLAFGGSVAADKESGSSTSLRNLDLMTLAPGSCYIWLEMKGSSLRGETGLPSLLVQPCGFPHLSGDLTQASVLLMETESLRASGRASFGQRHPLLQTSVQLLKASQGWARAGPCFHSQWPRHLSLTLQKPLWPSLSS